LNQVEREAAHDAIADQRGNLQPESTGPDQRMDTRRVSSEGDGHHTTTN
jgi:hypothetical protein